MAYTITKTNGDTLTTVPDTELNTEYGVTLIGRNYSGYGVFLNDNFISLIENFASASAPALPIDGQLWFNTTTKDLNLWEGSIWKSVAYLIDSGTAPSVTGRQIGDLWWDTTNFQLKLWSGLTVSTLNSTATTTENVLQVTSTSTLLVGDVVTHANIAPSEQVVVEQILSSNTVRITSNQPVGASEPITFTRGSGWYNIGPIYTKEQRLSGVVPTTITDTNAITHVVNLIYISGQVVAIISKDTEFTPSVAETIPRFGSIKPGFNLPGSGSLQKAKTVTANTVGSAGTTIIPLSSVDDLLIGDLYSSSTVSISAAISIAEIFTSNSSVRISTATSVTAGEIVTIQRGSESAFLYQGTVENAQKLDNISPDNYARRDRNETFKQNLEIVSNLTVANGRLSVSNADDQLRIQNSVRGGDIALISNIGGLSNEVVTLSISGTTGLIDVLGDPTTATGIVTKQYVDTDTALLRAQLAANVATIIGSETPEDRRDFGNISRLANTVITTVDTLTADVALKSYTNNPAFTGTPTSPTADAGTSTTQIATTAFVQTANSALRSEIIAVTDNLMSIKANISSPTFLGVPTAPTASAGTANTQIATTGFVASNSPVLSVAGKTGIVSLAVADITGAAPRANPELTGIPTAPTANVSIKNTQLATTAFVHGVLPTGIIMLWSGSASAIPFGWALCNGTSGTPDLRNRFVVGATSTYPVNGTGGSTTASLTLSSAGSHSHSGATANHTLTIAQMPAHNHVVVGNDRGTSSAQKFAPGLFQDDAERAANDLNSIANTGGSAGHSHNIGADGAHTHTVSGTIIPPYYALCYIMKVV
jgi:hypothetical protein